MATKLISALLVGLLSLTDAHAQEAQIELTPKKCITLNKGQLCYRTVQVNIKASTESDFCLIATVNSEPEQLKCWKKSDAALFKYRLASSQDVIFSVVDMSGQTVAKANLTVSWVYKKSRKRYRWRLF